MFISEVDVIILTPKSCGPFNKEIHSEILLSLQCPSLEPLIGLISSEKGRIQASDAYPHELTQITFSVATYHSTHGISIERCVQVFPPTAPH